MEQYPEIDLETLLYCNEQNGVGFRDYYFRFFKTRNGRNIMACGYKGQYDYYLYCPEEHLVYHVTTVQAYRLKSDTNPVPYNGAWRKECYRISLKTERALMDHVFDGEKSKKVYKEIMKYLNNAKEEDNVMPIIVEQVETQPIKEECAITYETAQQLDETLENELLREAIQDYGLKFRFVGSGEHKKCILARTKIGLIWKMAKELANGTKM